MVGKFVKAALFVSFLAVGIVHSLGALAQGTPSGWSKQEMDRFVDAVSESVVRKLATDPKLLPSKTAGSAAGVAEPGSVSVVAARLGEIGRAIPGVFSHFGSIPARLDLSNSGGMSFGGFMLAVLLIAAVGLGAEWLVRILTKRLVAKIVEGTVAPPHWARWLALTAIEALAIVALVVAGHAVYAPLFHSGSGQDKIAAGLLMTLLVWRLGIALLRCWLRPNLAMARLAPLNDADAAKVLRAFTFATAVSNLSRASAEVFSATGATRDEMVAQQFLNAPVVIGTFMATVLIVRQSMGRWLQALVSSGRDEENWLRVLMTKWYVGGVAYYLLVWLAVMYGGISGRIDLPAALNFLQQILIGWLLVETFMLALESTRLAASSDAVSREPQLVDIVWRAVHILIRIAAMIMLVRVATIDVLNIIPQSAWEGYSATLVSVGFALFTAWAVWQISHFYFERVGANVRGPVMPGAEEVEGEEEKLEGASRLHTLLPLLKTVVTVVIIGVTVLIVLSQLGINTTPLIAGASIFGLALSFGSQALVRDIVSGVFFLADDAFRVGEYIDVGKAKGTVESFTLRSIRLRHQGGQVHTIPFGQLGQITNFSRDWATVKFNLRFARETDIEALRKASKKIGLELMENPDLKEDFLLPLKLQGIADIQDNALIARFKFTVRPGRPSYIQRIAVKRMLEYFPEKGIEFASATVAVKNLDGSYSAGDVAAAAASRGLNAVPAVAG